MQSRMPNPDDLVDKALEAMGHVPGARRHAGILEESGRCCNSSLQYFCQLNQNLMMGHNEVHFGEH